MFHFKFVQHPTADDSKDLTERLKAAAKAHKENAFLYRLLTKQPPEHDQGRRQWISSRDALLKSLAELEGVPSERILASISHARTASAAICCDRDQFPYAAGLGLDIEEASRELSEKAADRVLFDHEKAMGVTPLQAWLIKEAVYKSDPLNSSAIIAHYEITSFDSEKGIAKAIRRQEPGFAGSVLIAPCESLILAVALSSNGPI